LKEATNKLRFQKQSLPAEDSKFEDVEIKKPEAQHVKKALAPQPASFMPTFAPDPTLEIIPLD